MSDVAKSFGKIRSWAGHGPPLTAPRSKGSNIGEAAEVLREEMERAEAARVASHEAARAGAAPA